jgi:hypothetical protein
MTVLIRFPRQTRPRSTLNRFCTQFRQMFSWPAQFKAKESRIVVGELTFSAQKLVYVLTPWIFTLKFVPKIHLMKLGAEMVQGACIRDRWICIYVHEELFEMLQTISSALLNETQ